MPAPPPSSSAIPSGAPTTARPTRSSTPRPRPPIAPGSPPSSASARPEPSARPAQTFEIVRRQLAGSVPDEARAGTTPSSPTSRSGRSAQGVTPTPADVAEAARLHPQRAWPIARAGGSGAIAHPLWRLGQARQCQRAAVRARRRRRAGRRRQPEGQRFLCNSIGLRRQGAGLIRRPTVSGVGKSGAIFAMLLKLVCGRGTLSSGVVDAVAALHCRSACRCEHSGAAWRCLAEPLDKESCLKLQGERRKLLTREMQAALDHGPDWVKDHLDDPGDRESAGVPGRRGDDQVPLPRRRRDRANRRNADRTFRRCRTASPPRRRARLPTAPDTQLPDRNPNPRLRRPLSQPSQTVADSDKTAPSKTKATR